VNVFTHSHVPEVSATHAMAMVEGGAVLVDIREMDEWLAGHAPMAIHIPMGELATRSVELNASDPILFICRSGRRSDHAVGALVKAGYHAINLTGGMQAWQQAGGAVVREDGSTGTVI
jgi:rhodanese-related sulfurtransferase